MDLQTITDRTIYLGIVGSNAYGTALPDGVSDFDYAGVCIPTKEYYIGNLNFEQANKWTDDNGNKIDKTIYAIQKAVKLMLDNNPNMMDLLFLDKTIVKSTPEWERIRQHRDKFLSTKMYHSYQGYQFSQIERIQTHRAYLLSPVPMPHRSDYGLGDKSVFPDTMVEVISKLASNYISEDNKDNFIKEMTALNDNEAVNIFRRYVEPHLVPIVMADFKQGQKAFLHMISSLSGRFIKDEYVSQAVDELRYLSSYWNWRRYSEWERNRNPKRKELEAKCGYDSKHAMHAIRLGRQCLEVMEGKGLNVDRTGIDGDELIDIRLGNRKFDWVLTESNNLMKKSTDLYSASTLPRSPDRKFIENIMMAITEEYVFGK